MAELVRTHENLVKLASDCRKYEKALRSVQEARVFEALYADGPMTVGQIRNAVGTMKYHPTVWYGCECGSTHGITSDETWEVSMGTDEIRRACQRMEKKGRLDKVIPPDGYRGQLWYVSGYGSSTDT